MKKGIVLTTIFLLVFDPLVFSQKIFESIPVSTDPSERYLFYLHGGVVQEMGIPAVNPYFGKYEYKAILDSLSGYKMHVISEVRSKGTEIGDYAIKLSKQVDTLLNAGIPAEHIVVVGASLGAYMTIEAAGLIDNPKIRYILIGLCSDFAVKKYVPLGPSLKGSFLSIYEESDAKGPCNSIFIDRNSECEFKEIKLTMGIDHAFLFQPYDEWVKPMMEWIRIGFD